MRLSVKKIKILLLSLMFVISSCYPTLAFAFEENQIFYNDPFGYTSDGQEGSEYPTDGTNQYNNKYMQDTVVNYDFNSNHGLDVVTGATVPATTQLLKGSSFEGGYHEYRDEQKQASVFTKKIVKPTQNPNVFDIQLDVISGKKETQEKIDIAFVFDKSTSMNERIDYYGTTRWDALKKSFDYFSNNFFSEKEYDVQFGLSSFGSFGTSQPFYEIAFNNNNYFFYSNSINTMKNNPLLVDKPGRYSNNGSGTPTFLGVDAGLELLRNSRNDSKTFLIFITDGKPTFNLSSNYEYYKNFSTNNYNNYDRNILNHYRNISTYLGNGTDKDRYGRPINLETAIDLGSLYSYTKRNYEQYPKVKKYSVGISKEATDKQNKRVLESLGPDGVYNVTDNIESDLKGVLNEIQSQIINSVASISNGTIVDEMSEFVTLKPETVSSYQLKLKDNNLNSTPVASGQVDAYAKNAIVNKDSNKISVSNLTLSGDQQSSNGYRITYQVELKPEYRNGHFYPANQPTFIYDDNNPKGIGFAVPSVKNNLRDISVEKKWKGDQTPHPAITFKLYANNEFQEEITLNNGQTNHIFKNYPVLDDQGELIDYTITESPVSGYKSTVEKKDDGNFIVTNTPMGQFKATKKASKQKLKPEEAFKYTIDVTNTVKDSLLKNITVEDTMPDGIEIVGNLTLNGNKVDGINGNTFKVTIPELLGNQTATIEVDVKVNGTTAEGIKQNIATVTNPEDPDNPQKPPAEVEVIRESNLLLKKTDLDGKKQLPDAEFDLVQIIGNQEKKLLTVKTNNLGEIQMNQLKTGNYLIRETKAPEGYQVLETPIEFHVTKFGELILDKSPKGLASLSINKDLNQFELLVKNEEELPEPGILPETGGFGHGKFVIVASILMTISLLLTIYFLYHRRKGWR